MSIRNEIIQILNRDNQLGIPITETTDLYQDLHFDSLSFVCTILDLEERFKITVQLSEMERCLVAGQLIALVTEKLREKEQ